MRGTDPNPTATIFASLWPGPRGSWYPATCIWACLCCARNRLRAPVRHPAPCTRRACCYLGFRNGAKELLARRSQAAGSQPKPNYVGRVGGAPTSSTGHVTNGLIGRLYGRRGEDCDPGQATAKVLFRLVGARQIPNKICDASCVVARWSRSRPEPEFVVPRRPEFSCCRRAWQDARGACRQRKKAVTARGRARPRSSATSSACSAWTPSYGRFRVRRGRGSRTETMGCHSRGCRRGTGGTGRATT